MKNSNANPLKLGFLALVVGSTVWLGFGGKQHYAANVVNHSARAGNDKLVWFDNYQAALEEAKATGKPIFLEFRCAP